MTDEIKSIINDCGIMDVGFCDFALLKDKLLDCRAKTRLPQNAKTVIVCLFPYKVNEQPPKNISRYAAVPDYHKVCGDYLERAAEKLKNTYKDNKFECFIDNSPIPEVLAAALGGLGVKGENGLLINEKYGSFVFIGEIVTDIKIKCENEIKNCSLCGVCKSACPRGVHGTDCLSAVSQQKKDLTEPQSRALRENNIVWGCDICAEVCPMNQNAKTTYIKEFIDGYRDAYTLGEDIKNRAYEWRGEKTVQRNFKNLISG